MKKALFVLISLVFLFGCDNSVGPSNLTQVDTIPAPDIVLTNPGHESNLTCLEAVQGSFPKGTYARLQKAGNKVKLSDNGCYSFATSAVAAREMATNDSVIFYNDSALFTLTIPYQSGTDTIQIVPTQISLKNVPNNQVDSVYLVVYDKTNILSRKIKLRKTDYGDSSDYGRTLWSVDGANFQVHFDIHGNTTSASTIIKAQSGGIVSREYYQIKSVESLRFLNIADSMFFWEITPPSIAYDGDTMNKVTKNQMISKSGSFKIEAYSIYGIQQIKVNGIVKDSLNSPLKMPYYDSLTMNEKGSVRSYSITTFDKVNVTITDSAGYSITKEVKMWTDDQVLVTVSTNPLAKGMVRSIVWNVSDSLGTKVYNGINHSYLSIVN